MYIKKLLRNYQIPPDLVVKQTRFAFRDNLGRDSYLLFCDFYTYDDRLNVGQCFRSVGHVLFNEGTDDSFMDFNGTRGADCFTYRPSDANAEGQVVTFSTLREDFAGQVLFFRHFSSVAAPVITATTPIQNGANRANSSQQTSSFRGPRV